MQVKNKDAPCQNLPTIGYSNLLLPEAMDDESVNGMMHSAAAEVAMILKADRVVVDDMFEQRTGSTVSDARNGK